MLPESFAPQYRSSSGKEHVGKRQDDHPRDPTCIEPFRCDRHERLVDTHAGAGPSTYRGLITYLFEIPVQINAKKDVYLICQPLHIPR
jgi:hypothetical protein